MTAHYRLVHYEPDPFSGLRFTLGALVSDGARLRGTAAERLPGADCLGGAGHARLVAVLAAQLEAASDVAAVERGFGPHVRVSERRPLPVGVGDAAGWVRAHVLPRRATTPTAPRGAQLPTLGHAFFRTWGVGQWVKKTFSPTKDGGRWLDGRAHGLQPITHWVEGADRLLLMEPVSPDRRQLDEDLATLATRFLAWRSVLPEGAGGGGRLVAYVLTGGDARRRAAARDVLHDKVDLLVDTDDHDQRAELVAEIAAVGRSGAPQGDLAT